MRGNLVHTFLAFFATIYLSSFSLKVQAQQKPDEFLWRETEVILTSGDTIRGNSILRFLDDMISVKLPDGKLQAFSAHNVRSFQVKGAEKNYTFVSQYGPAAAANLKWNYQTYLWNRDKGYSDFRSPAFFVVLQPGKYTLLMRENRKRSNQSTPVPVALKDSYTGNLSVSDSYAEFETQFYLATADNKLLLLRKPKKDLVKYYPLHRKKILNFAEEKSLSFKKWAELSQIVQYANSISAY